MGSTSGDNEGSGFPRRYIDCTRPWTTRLCLLYRSLHAYDLVICASSCGWPDTYSVAPTPMPFSAVRWVSVVAVDAVDFPLDLTFPSIFSALSSSPFFLATQSILLPIFLHPLVTPFSVVPTTSILPLWLVRAPYAPYLAHALPLEGTVGLACIVSSSFVPLPPAAQLHLVQCPPLSFHPIQVQSDTTLLLNRSPGSASRFIMKDHYYSLSFDVSPPHP